MNRLWGLADRIEEIAGDLIRLEAIGPDREFSADSGAMDDALTFEVRAVDRAKMAGRAIVPHCQRIGRPAEADLQVLPSGKFVDQIVDQRAAFPVGQADDVLDEAWAEEQRLPDRKSTRLTPV